MCASYVLFHFQILAIVVKLKKEEAELIATLECTKLKLAGTTDALAESDKEKQSVESVQAIRLQM